MSDSGGSENRGRKMLRYTELVISLLITLGCPGCGDIRSAGRGAGQSPTQTQASPPPPAPASIPSDTIITLERTVCYGQCPSYKITIFADGTVIYEGRKFVKTMGEVRSKLNQEELRQLVSEAERISYFSLKDRYETFEDGCGSYATDGPFYNTSIQMNGKRKAIRHYSGCNEKDMKTPYPPGLAEFEQDIDETVNSRQWVK